MGHFTDRQSGNGDKGPAMIETAKPDSLVGMFSFGGLSHDQVTRSIELFATKVRPALGA